MITLLHFHLRDAIMVGKKKTNDIQFYTEVRHTASTATADSLHSNGFPILGQMSEGVCPYTFGNHAQPVSDDPCCWGQHGLIEGRNVEFYM